MKFKLKFPDTYVLIFCIIVLCGVASYFIPSGAYDMHTDEITGILYAEPGSYHTISQSYVSLFQIFASIPEGMTEVGDVILFILMVGGSFEIIQATGVLNIAIETIARKCVGRELVVIPIIMTLFSLMGAVMGSAEELLPLVPIFVTLSLSMGFDVITGVALISLGTLIGYTTGMLNPFTTGIAQKLCGLPLFSGICFRAVCYAALLIPTIIFVCHYAGKVKNHALEAEKLNEECVFIEDFEDYDLKRIPQISKRHIAILCVILIGLVSILYGVLVLNFGLTDISTVFIIMGILSGLIGGYKVGRIISEFINGASNMLYGALIIGLTRGIFIVMREGGIVDTVIYYVSHLIAGVSPVIDAALMFIAHTIICFFITSSTGEASMTMPIMSGMADLLDITRQTAVLAYQLADGFTNAFSPFCGYFMAILAISGCSYKKWLKWIWPLIIIWYIVGGILIVVSVLMRYGPF